MKGHFAYQSGYLICGGCGHTMSPYIPSTLLDNEYTYRVYCGNSNCPAYLEVYEPSDKFKVSLIPTRLRAIDPNTMAGTAGTLGAMTQQTTVTTAAERARLAQARAMEIAVVADRLEAMPGTIPPTAPIHDRWHTFNVDNNMLEVTRISTRDEVVEQARELVERNNAIRR